MSLRYTFLPVKNKCRLFFRNVVRPIPVDEAEERREIWSFMYMCVSGVLLGSVLYNIFKSENSSSSPKTIKEKAERLGISGTMNVYKIKNFTEIHNDVIKLDDKGNNVNVTESNIAH